MKHSSKKGYKKIPHSAPYFTENEFINQPEKNNTLTDRKETSSFLIRIPNEVKKRLKKYAFDNENNMNQVCIKAIKEFLDRQVA